ncbi:SNF2 family N-terminal domain-containing protein [Roridomyces roridus]|uniref:SNF2 family N-terminal domain-containing protein n=1 Tax=Roridomyces roridus TaxID=1738132 RepID=A0AAD7FST7_9AGAR|nr:SNF2 family N-terminal domain-containing protein [Roridomyces roridus]
MAATSPAELVSLAKTHLSLPPTANASSVPHAYLEELRNHLNLYPHDTLFRVTLEPGKGFGFVTCLEDGCDSLRVPLIKRIKAKDGGIRIGLGSLSAYRAHIESHGTHKQKRLERIGGGSARQASSIVKLEPKTEVPPFGTPKPSGSQPKRSSLVRLTPHVKPELVEPTIPHKRASEVAFGVKSENDGATKKLKLEPQVEKVPLAQVDKNAVVPQTPVAAVDVEEVRRKIAETQSLINHYQTLLDRITHKRKPTKSDLTRLKNHAAELTRLRKTKSELDAQLPRAAPSPIKRTSSKVLTKTESLAKLPPPFHHPAFGGPSPKVEGLENPFAPVQSDVKPVYQNAVASSSKGPGSLADSSDEMDVDPMATLNKYIHNIPNIAPVTGLDHSDANGDYHGRGADTFLGPQAKADDIDKFLMQAGNAEQFDGDESIEKALEKLGLQSPIDLLPSLGIPLMPHQLLGVAWMVEKEKAKAYKGGCLADEMGLGMIATMCKNPSQNAACKTTLILAPLALLKQWQNEIAQKTTADWKVLIYHSQNKVKRKSDLLKYDVVLTTYQTMALEWPDYEREEKKKAKAKKKADDFIASDSDDSGSDHAKKKGKKDRGLLFQVDFYRVVLDEAQNIRNKMTRVSRAVTDLSAELRWCLSATPLINGLKDAYGPIRFLRVRPWYDWSDFNSHVARLEKKNPQLAVTRLQAIFRTFLLRRMKDTMLNGKRLIELPEKTVELVSLIFSQEERDIYQMVETKSQEKFNRYLKAGTVLKNYASVLQHRDELSRARSIMSNGFVQKMKDKFKEAALRRIEAEKESADAAVDEEDSTCPICFDVFTSGVVTPCAHQFCKDCIMGVLQMPLPDGADPAYKANERPCPSCRSPVCEEKLFLAAAFEPTDKDLAGDADEEEDVEMEDVKPTLPVSKGKGKAKAKRPARKNTARKFIVLDSSDDEAEDVQSEYEQDSDLEDFIVQSDEDEEEKDAVRNSKKRLGKRRATTIVDSDDEIEEDLPEEKEILFGARNKKLSKEAIKMMPKFLPSTKMKKMMDIIKQLAEEKPDEKTIVVSQWTGCLTLCSDYLTEAGIVHVKYQGDMTPNKREQAVQVFMSKDKARIMLMSLKCGGVGLNLTRANNVISLDLGWSPAIDAQAFDRVHRLGQNRKVMVSRLVIADTVEDRILALQERKKNLADCSLGEGNGKKIGRLTVRELASLFGLDARGRVLTKD